MDESIVVLTVVLTLYVVYCEYYVTASGGCNSKIAAKQQYPVT